MTPRRRNHLDMMAGTMITARHIAVVRTILLLIAAAMPASRAVAASTTTRTATTRPDPTLWIRRNIDLIREASKRKADPDTAGGIGSTLMFSLAGNRLLVRDPYAGEVLKIVEAATTKAGGDSAKREVLDQAAAYLRLPQEQRVLRQLLQKIDELNNPLIEPGDSFGVATTLGRLPPMGEPYDSYVARMIEQMDAAERKVGQWPRLALSYQSLASDSLKLRGPNDARTKLYTDRLLAILREHPQFQDLRRGNCDGPEPAAAVKLLDDAGRKHDLDDLIAKLNGQPKIDLLLGVVEAHARADKLDEARRVIDDQIRALAPTTAMRLKTALAGRVTTLPAAATVPTVTRFDRFGRPHAVRGEVDVNERRLRNVLLAIAQAHARRGDVDLAARQWITLEADDITHFAGEGELPSFEWATLADEAWDAGHTDAARAAYEHALKVLQPERGLKPEQYQEKARFVREALDVGAEDLAFELMETTSQPEAWGRQVLAAAYRKRGDAKRADELTEAALAIVRQDGDDSRGSAMADIATDLYTAGDTQRAEKVLLESIGHIKGEDFGFGGTEAVVRAAVRIKRLDVLDRMYAQGKTDEKLLLCIVATDVGMGDEASEEKDK